MGESNQKSFDNNSKLMAPPDLSTWPGPVIRLLIEIQSATQSIKYRMMLTRSMPWAIYYIIYRRAKP